MSWNWAAGQSSSKGHTVRPCFLSHAHGVFGNVAVVLAEVLENIPSEPERKSQDLGHTKPRFSDWDRGFLLFGPV